MRRVKSLCQIRAQRDGQLERLAHVAEIRLPLVWKHAGVGERHDVGDDGVATLVRRDQTERREDSCRRRHEHGRHVELLRERARMQWPGASERDEREVARVEPLLDGDDAERPRHLGVHDLDDAGRIEVAESACRRRFVEGDPTRQPRREPAEEQVGIRNRRALPASAVARGARVGAGALRSDAERTACVLPDDRASARADCVNGERGKAHREAADHARVLSLRITRDDRADVRRGAAHVECERIVVSRERCHLRGADDARSRPGEERERGVSGGLFERGQAARGAHHERLRHALSRQASESARRYRPRTGLR